MSEHDISVLALLMRYVNLFWLWKPLSCPPSADSYKSGIDSSIQLTMRHAYRIYQIFLSVCLSVCHSASCLRFTTARRPSPGNRQIKIKDRSKEKGRETDWQAYILMKRKRFPHHVIIDVTRHPPVTIFDVVTAPFLNRYSSMTGAQPPPPTSSYWV